MQKIITKRPNGSRRVSHLIETPSKTQQTFKDDCDVNLILERFTKTGELSHLSKKTPTYSDVSEIPNLLEAHIQIKEAKDMFNQLPARLRKKLGNHPTALEDYLKDPANHEEAEEFGLLTITKKQEKKQEPQKEKDSGHNDDSNDDNAQESKSKKGSND